MSDQQVPTSEEQAMLGPDTSAATGDPVPDTAEVSPVSEEAVTDDAVLHGDGPVPQEQPAPPPAPVELDPLRPVTMDDLVVNELQVTIGGHTYWMQPLASFGRAKQARIFALWNRSNELEKAAGLGYFEYPNPDPVAAEEQPMLRLPVDLDEVDDEILENQREMLKVAIRGVSREALDSLIPEQVDQLVQRFLALLSVPTRRRGAALTLLKQVI